MNILLWILQALAGIAFLMAGSMKLSMPKDKLIEKVGGWVYEFSDSTIKVIGLTEILGAVGLVFPMLFNTIPVLTLFAAGGLALIMVLAAATHIRRKEPVIPNIVLFIISVFILYGRLSLVPVI